MWVPEGLGPLGSRCPQSWSSASVPAAAAPGLGRSPEGGPSPRPLLLGSGDVVIMNYINKSSPLAAGRKLVARGGGCGPARPPPSCLGSEPGRPVKSLGLSLGSP